MEPFQPVSNPLSGALAFSNTGALLTPWQWYGIILSDITSTRQRPDQDRAANDAARRTFADVPMPNPKQKDDPEGPKKLLVPFLAELDWSLNGRHSPGMNRHLKGQKLQLTTIIDSAVGL